MPPVEDELTKTSGCDLNPNVDFTPPTANFPFNLTSKNDSPLSTVAMSSRQPASRRLQLMPYSTFNPSLVPTFHRTSKNICYLGLTTNRFDIFGALRCTKNIEPITIHPVLSCILFELPPTLEPQDNCAVGSLCEVMLATSFLRGASAMITQTWKIYWAWNDPPQVVNFNSSSAQWNGSIRQSHAKK